ncbi:MAG: BON domain-containing protein [Pseudomonadota bacterium]
MTGLTILFCKRGVSLLPTLGLGLALLANAGCVPLAIGAGAATGVAIAEERSVGAALDDTTIRVNVGALMLKEDEQLASMVDIEVLEGRVLLTGSVRNANDRVSATMITWRSPGVKEVINELQVKDKSTLGNMAKDSWITTKLRTKILTNTSISDINYSIETVNGVVYLLGIAQNQQELDAVTNYARNISGVTRVVSYVRLKDQRSPAPVSAPPVSAPMSSRDDIQGDLLPPGGVPATGSN